VEATYRNGLLMLTMPKSEEAKPRQIRVQTTGGGTGGNGGNGQTTHPVTCPRPAWQQRAQELRRELQALGDQGTLATNVVQRVEQPRGNDLRGKRAAEVTRGLQQAEAEGRDRAPRSVGSARMTDQDRTTPG